MQVLIRLSCGWERISLKEVSSCYAFGMYIPWKESGTQVAVYCEFVITFCGKYTAHSTQHTAILTLLCVCDACWNSVKQHLTITYIISTSLTWRVRLWVRSCLRGLGLRYVAHLLQPETFVLHEAGLNLLTVQIIFLQFLEQVKISYVHCL